MLGVVAIVGVRLTVGVLEAVKVMIRVEVRPGVGVLVPVRVEGEVREGMTGWVRVVVVVWDPVEVAVDVLVSDGLEVKVRVWLGVSEIVGVSLGVYVCGWKGVKVDKAVPVRDGTGDRVGIAGSRGSSRGLNSTGNRQPIRKHQNKNTKRTTRFCMSLFRLKHTG